MKSLVLGQTKEASRVTMKSRDHSEWRGNQRGRGLQRRGAMSVGDGTSGCAHLRSSLSSMYVMRSDPTQDRQACFAYLRSEETRWAGDE